MTDSQIWKDIDWIGRAAALTPAVRNFVSGQWSVPGGGQQIEKFGPRDGKFLCQFGAGDAKDVDAAVESARCAFVDGRWSKLASSRRREILLELARLVELHRDELALLESLDVGKPIADAYNIDIPFTAGLIRFNAEMADKLTGAVYACDGRNLSYQLYRPLGVVAGIVGWNFPLALAASKIGPALAAGNSLVLKPSEDTSLSTARIAELAIEAGVPDGVFNVINGGGHIGSALAHHPDVDLLTFTGSTATGKKLLVASGQSNMKRLVLECGGKAANIVFEDCPDLDAVAEAVVARAFWNQGQVCTASSRLLVHENVKEALLSRIIEKASSLLVGDPLRPETNFGALSSRKHRDKVIGYIDGAAQQGARLAHQAEDEFPFEEGFYVSPVIFDMVSPEQTIAREEIFGPVLSVISFRDEEAALRIANGTIYGLSAIVWTRDLGRAHRMIQGLDVGWTVVNATESPSGGPGAGVLEMGGHKQSGFGTEGGIEGLKHYMSNTAVQLFV